VRNQPTGKALQDTFAFLTAILGSFAALAAAAILIFNLSIWRVSGTLVFAHEKNMG
jgi:hypothetical protein